MTYFYSKLLDEKPRKIDVFEQLVCIDTEWREIGNRLGVDANSLNGIAKTLISDQIRLDKVLQKWMDMDGHPPCSPVTWKAILEALEKLKKYDLKKAIYQHLKL